MVLSTSNMLLSIIYDLSKGTAKKIRFEDIAVAAFKKYPAHFALKGYAEYPDSGDAVHRPLYSLKKQGFLVAQQKYFSLTESGKVLAEKIAGYEQKHGAEDKGRLSRDVQNEINRVTGSEALKLFASGLKDKILDTDFYSYLGTTVRTERSDFIARLNTMTRVAEEAKKIKEYEIVYELDKFLVEKFKPEIEYKKAHGRKFDD